MVSQIAENLLEKFESNGLSGLVVQGWGAVQNISRGTDIRNQLYSLLFLMTLVMTVARREPRRSMSRRTR